MMIKNKLKTFILLSALSALFLVFGFSFGGRSGLQIAIIMAVVMNFFAYFYSDKMVLNMYKAKLLDKHKFDKIYDIVKDLTKSMQIPMPKLWLIETPMANAFATGRNPENASIALTTGILDILDIKELKAVLAHEMAHIKNRDILVTTIAATIATAIGYLANMLQYSLMWGSRENNRRNPLGTLALAILMPIAAVLIQLSISRSREYLADETGSEHGKDPLALASALEKLHENIKYAHLRNDDAVKASTASLFIVHPFTSTDWMTFFSTHPPMPKRIERLKEIYKLMFKKNK